jgi:hypothetical protein
MAVVSRRPVRAPGALRRFVTLFGEQRTHPLLEMTLIVCGLVVLFAVPVHQLGGDNGSRLYDIEQLLHHGRLIDDRYSLVGPLLSSPFLLLGEVIGSPSWWAAHFNTFVVAIALVAMFRLTRGRIDPAFMRRFTLILLFASLITDGTRAYGAETVTAALVALGTLAVATGRHRLLGWVAIVIGVVNTPAALAGRALVAAVRAFETKRLRPFLALAAAALVVMGEAWLRRGSPFTTGYESDTSAKTIMPYSGHTGFSYPFVLGVVSILFSFGRGLVFFAPGLLLWLSARTRRLGPAKDGVVLQLAFLAGLVMLYAKWWAWYGGLTWGPRFFIIGAVPASLLLARRAEVRDPADADTIGGYTLTLGLLALSAWVGLVAALGDLTRMSVCAGNGYQWEMLCWYTPEYSALWWPVIHYPVTVRGLILGLYFLIVFAYLAAPLAREILRGVLSRREHWAYGWRL